MKTAVYGKGGIGKSVVATNLSASFSMDGKQVLHVGCDPKHDSSIRLLDAPDRLVTVTELMGNSVSPAAAGRMINRGRHGIDLIEAGGPSPGLGCAGRGVARTLELFEDIELLEGDRYDVAVFDVLGDVVCGGFAAPLRRGFAELIMIVVSAEPMSLFAANNIAKAVVAYQDNGVFLGGLIANLRGEEGAGVELVERFAERLGTQILEVIRHDPQVQVAERELQTIVEYAPDSAIAGQFRRLARTVAGMERSGRGLPEPLEDDAFFAFLREG